MTEQWWQNSIVYQIYPQSFNDSNGDGIGDIQGIIQKLDYLQDLGINTIWICPIFQSPLVDNGYDISDYYAIDPRYGALGDLIQLIQEARERNIKILLDLVVNHCSDQHEWFKRALADPEGEYGQFFIIRNGIDGREPNNWRSIFGGSVWEKIPGADSYYYHTFSKHQPDFNWDNKALRYAIYTMIKYWLALGIAGFRIDAITFIKKDLSFRSLPADRSDGLISLRTVGVNYPGIEDFLHEMRQETFDVYDAFSVAEMASVNPAHISSYIGKNGFFSSIFDFSFMNLDLENGNLWYKHRPFDAEAVKKALFPHQKAAQEHEALLSIVLENHDQPRALNKWFKDDEICFQSTALLAVLNLSLRGIPFLFQGQEIGMTNRSWSGIDEIHDVKSIYQYQSAIQEGVAPEEAFRAVAYRSRDNARGFMQWDSPSTGNILKFYKRLIALRNSEKYGKLFIRGDIQPLAQEYDDIIAYARSYSGRRLHVILNYHNAESSLDYDYSIVDCLISNYDEYRLEDKNLHLRPFEAMILEVAVCGQ